MVDGSGVKTDWTKDDLFNLSSTFISSPFASIISNPLWRQAFNFYNLKSGKTRVSMGSRPCFPKVYKFIESYLDNS